MKKWRLRAPATSANLGPGFDCLGLALELWNEVDVELTTRPGLELHVTGEGAYELPLDERHLLVQVAFGLLRERGLATPTGLSLHCTNRLPLARGLGSSAATRVLGVMLAELLAGQEPDVDELLQQAGRAEGHPDNVAAAVFGGLTTSLADEDGYRSLSCPMHPCWQVALAVPSFALETEKSRGVLPDSYRRAEAVFNLARVPWLLRGLADGSPELVARGCRDCWHQGQRSRLIPGFARVEAAARPHAFYLSGAGPTLAALVDTRSEPAAAVAERMRAAWADAGVDATAHALTISHRGAGLQRLA